MPGWLDDIKEGWKAHRRGVTEEGLHENYANVQGNLANERAVDKYIFERDNPGQAYIEPSGVDMWRQEIDALMASGDDRLQDIAVDSMGRQQTAESRQTGDMQEYRLAVSQGFTGTFDEWKIEDAATTRSGGTYGNQMFYTRDGENIKAWRMAPGGGMTEVLADEAGEFLLPSGIAASDIPTIKSVRAAEREEEVLDFAAMTPLELEAVTEEAYSVAKAENKAALEHIYEVSDAKYQLELDDAIGADWSKADSMRTNLDSMNVIANDVIDNINLLTTGFIGSIVQHITGTEANDLESQLQVLKSRAGLDQLLDLKAQGGTLGALNVEELRMLQTYVTALEIGLSPARLTQNVKVFQAFMEDMWTKYQVVEGATGNVYDPAGPRPRPRAPGSDVPTVIDYDAMSSADFLETLRGDN